MNIPAQLPYYLKETRLDMATVKTKLNIDSDELKKIKLVAVAYSFVDRDLFPNEEAYNAEKEVEDRAQQVIE